MSIKSAFGLDGVDLGIHVLVTGVILFWISAVNSSRDATIGCSVATVSSLVLLDIRRRLALRRIERRGLTTGEMAAERIAELEQRLAELEGAMGRVAELEERVDFAERLLAQSSAEQRALGGTEAR